MKLIKTKNYEEMSMESLNVLLEQIKKKPDSVIGFTTGASPEGMIKALADAVNQGLDISDCTFLNMDEFICDPALKVSVRFFMNHYLYGQISQGPKQVFLLDGMAPDREAEIKRYAGLLSQHPRDMQFLGLGVNGHIGANEPGTPFDSTLFVSDLTESTFVKTMKQFDLTEETTPRQMYTMGFAEIMAAEQVVLQVSGESKAEAMKALVEGPVDPSCPASLLKTHKNFWLIADEAACSLLK